MDPITSVVVIIIILLFSVIFHEVAHGLVADKLGDPTARYAGRLTLNPVPHIDLFGSILLPAILYLTGLPIFGAAKPVPVNYFNLSNVRRDMFLVAFAGPATNLILASVGAVAFRIFPGLSDMGEQLLLQMIYINILLAVFNSLPIPPLDGSKMLASILGYIDHNLMYRLLDFERFGFILLILLIMIPGVLGSVLLPPVTGILNFLLGTDFRIGF